MLITFIEHTALGPSINDVNIFFWIFDTNLPHVGTFYMYLSALLHQFLTLPSQKVLTYFMDTPLLHCAIEVTAFLVLKQTGSLLYLVKVKLF